MWTAGGSAGAREAFYEPLSKSKRRTSEASGWTKRKKGERAVVRTTRRRTKAEKLQTVQRRRESAHCELLMV